MMEYVLITGSNLSSAFTSFGDWAGNHDKELTGIGVLAVLFVVCLLTFKK